jgi:hypothetical protein
MQKFLLSTLLLILILIPIPGFAASCEFLPASAQPDWINGERSIGNYYVGVGVASKSSKGSEHQIRKSQQDAMRDLSENIEVTIKSQLTIRQSSGDSTSFTNKEAESLIVTSSNASLKNVTTDEVWLDRNSCLVWTRVKIKKSIVENESSRQQQFARIEKLRNLIDSIESDTVDSQAALETLELASTLLAYIDFAMVNAEADKSELDLRIRQLGESLQDSAQASATAESLFKDAREALRLRKTDTVNKKQHLNNALNTYRRIVTDYPFGDDPNHWSEQASFQIATLELQRKNSCAAQVYLNKIKDLSENNKWVLKSKKMLRKAKCSTRDRLVYNFKNMFDAKKVSVECRYDSSDDLVWTNACDKIVSHFNSNGAIAARQNGLSSANNPEFKILVTGKGQLNQRNSSGKTEYQFQGDISTRLSSRSQLILEDTYSGIGGWNPVSGQMAMDVLGIHVYKRFIKALNKELEG